MVHANAEAPAWRPARHREETGTTADEIDLYFGWKEKTLKKATQMHYAAMSIVERMRQRRITGCM